VRGMRLLNVQVDVPIEQQESWPVCTAVTSPNTAVAGRRPPWPGPDHYLPWTDLVRVREGVAVRRADGARDGLHDLPFTRFGYNGSWRILRTPLGPHSIDAPDEVAALAFLRHEYGEAWAHEVPYRPRCTKADHSTHVAEAPPQLSARATAVARRWLVEQARRGVRCGPPAAPHEPSDCHRGAIGAWELSEVARRNWTVATAACLARCSLCARCRHITVSLEHNVCAWSSSCSRRRSGTPKETQHRASYRSGPALRSIEQQVLGMDEDVGDASDVAALRTTAPALVSRVEADVRCWRPTFANHLPQHVHANRV
jgi:hypothetical protein